MHQMGFAQTHTAIDKQGVVKLARHIGHMHGCRTGHPVGSAFNQRVKAQAAVEAVLETIEAIVSHGRRGKTKTHLFGFLRRTAESLTWRGFFGRQDEIELDVLTIQLGQKRGNPAGVLGANPIQFETVAHHHADLGKVFRNNRLQRFDPGIELLLGQFLRQLIDAGLPQSLPGVSVLGAQIHVLLADQIKLWIDLI